MYQKPTAFFVCFFGTCPTKQRSSKRRRWHNKNKKNYAREPEKCVECFVVFINLLSVFPNAYNI